MRKMLLLFVLLGFINFTGIHAQGLTPSTVRQVFSLQKGDSLEYHVWNYGACSPLCNFYILKTVDSLSYNVAQDSLSIFFVTQILHFDSSGVPNNYSSCGQCHIYFVFTDICPIASDQWTMAYTDSSILFSLDTTYRSGLGYVYDSIYTNSAFYNGSKQNYYIYGGDDFQGTTDIYADSVGIVYKEEGVELASNNREQLIYYHKANGSTWGIPFVSTGIANINDDYHISIFPNPAVDRFQIQTERYQGMRFELYDVLAEKVISLNLTAKGTEVNRNDLPSGIYYWQISDGVNTIKAGKLIME